MLSRARRARIGKPRMFVRSVVHHQVQEDADISFLGLCQQPVEVFQRAILRRDVAIVGNVVAKINLRRGKAGRDPNGVDPQSVQIIELGSYAVDVAHAVVVAVREAARIYLVENGMLPPRMLFTRARLLRLRKAQRNTQKEEQSEFADFHATPQRAHMPNGQHAARIAVLFSDLHIPKQARPRR